ncbi:MAG TPA: deoxyribose-phosphate aldolase, partial [Candidatus Sumerlaeota bacterium]|nr:deoxyribose-phosphate aldolase [Candidatus Sumerlaeota bacterium]
FASVCVNPCHVALAARELAGTQVMVCTVIGFPLGSTTTETKTFETRDACANGAHEIDMVINIGKLKAGDFHFVCDDIRAVVDAAQGRTVKVILETSMLSNEEKVAGCILSKAAGAQFVKTSTGFGGGGATPEDIALMRKTVGEELGVKASGGVRDCEGAEKLIAAGASRLGASASVAIVAGKKGTGAY